MTHPRPDIVDDQSSVPSVRGDDVVPPDQRIAGFDRRTVWPAAVLVIVWAVWAHLMPWIDDRIAVDNPIVAGDVIELGGGTFAFDPAVGWELVDGVLAGGDQRSSLTATLVSGAVTYKVRTATWNGTDDELLDHTLDVETVDDRLLARSERERGEVTSTNGARGKVAFIEGHERTVIAVSYVFSVSPGEEGGEAVGLGVAITVSGPSPDVEDRVEDINSMIRSIR